MCAFMDTSFICTSIKKFKNILRQVDDDITQVSPSSLQYYDGWIEREQRHGIEEKRTLVFMKGYNDCQDYISGIKETDRFTAGRVDGFRDAFTKQDLPYIGRHIADDDKYVEGYEEGWNYCRITLPY